MRPRAESGERLPLPPQTEAMTDGFVDPELIECPKGCDGVLLGSDRAQLVAKARAGDGAERAGGDRSARQRGGRELDDELEPSLIAGETQQASRVVDEAALVQNPKTSADRGP